MRGRKIQTLLDVKWESRSLFLFDINPWMRKIPWRGKWQPTPVFLAERKIPLTEEPGGLRSIGETKESGTTEHAHTFIFASAIMERCL